MGVVDSFGAALSRTFSGKKKGAGTPMPEPTKRAGMELPPKLSSPPQLPLPDGSARKYKVSFKGIAGGADGPQRVKQDLEPGDVLYLGEQGVQVVKDGAASFERQMTEYEAGMDAPDSEVEYPFDPPGSGQDGGAYPNYPYGDAYNGPESPAPSRRMILPEQIGADNRGMVMPPPAIHPWRVRRPRPRRLSQRPPRGQVLL